MEQSEPIQLEDYAGQRLYMQFVSYVPMGYCGRIHLVKNTHNFTDEIGWNH